MGGGSPNYYCITKGQMINVYDESGNIISMNLTISCQYLCMIPKYFNLVKLGFRASNMRRMFQLHLLYDHKMVAIPIWIFLICLLGILHITPENPAISFSKIHMYVIFLLGIYIPHICHFFTRAKFLDNKIYTEKRQFFALNL